MRQQIFAVGAAVLECFWAPPFAHAWQCANLWRQSELDGLDPEERRARIDDLIAERTVSHASLIFRGRPTHVTHKRNQDGDDSFVVTYTVEEVLKGQLQGRTARILYTFLETPYFASNARETKFKLRSGHHHRGYVIAHQVRSESRLLRGFDGTAGTCTRMFPGHAPLAAASFEREFDRLRAARVARP